MSIIIEDDDSPIEAAAKIAHGTLQRKLTPLDRAMRTALTGEDDETQTVDMFTVHEIGEIADYLRFYYEKHKFDEINLMNALKGETE